MKSYLIHSVDHW